MTLAPIEIAAVVLVVLFLILLPKITNIGDFIKKNPQRRILRVVLFILICLPALIVLFALILIERFLQTTLDVLGKFTDYLLEGIFGAEKS